jgi:phage terminase small subunit
VKLRPTLPLTEAARGYWDRHARRLARLRILTPGDLDSFTLLCVTWGMLSTLSDTQPGADQFREMVQLANLQKQYLALARQFGLVPRERRAAKLEGEKPEQKDEFGL